MAKGEIGHVEAVFIPPEFWDLLQTTLAEAIGICNDIASSVEAHQRLGIYNAKELLDQMNGQAREIRKLLEMIEAPF